MRDHISYEYRCTQVDDYLNIFNPEIKTHIAKQILERWYKNRALRKLYLFGLYDREIDTVFHKPNEIYDHCMTDPYKILTIPIEKADNIYNIIKIKPNNKFVSYLNS